MNRSIALVGVAVVLAGIGLVAFPIVVTGVEQLDMEQIAGFLVAPLGLFVVLIAAVSVDPSRTTVHGTFGNSDEAGPEDDADSESDRRPRPVGFSEPVHCRYCRTVITPDLSRCPRCSRARECKTCGRPLGQVLERPTCPRCAQAEPFCSCPILPRTSPERIGRAAR